MFALATYRIAEPFGSTMRLAAVIDGARIVDLQSAIAHHREAVLGDPQGEAIARVRAGGTLQQFIAAGQVCFEETRAAVQSARAAGLPASVRLSAGERRLSFALNEVELCCPLMPGKIISAGRNYLDHQLESNMPKPDDFPRGFLRVNSSLAGPGALPYPDATREFDYEAELAVIIGRPGRDIPVERAMEHVFGYTIHNDLSARDWQLEERKKGNHLIGKNLDATGPLGPWVVPAEFLPDPMNLELALRVNGQQRQATNTRLMMYNIAELVSHWSKMTLEPGDLISTGTPAGVAVGHKGDDAQGYYLKVGDVVEAEVQGIGVLRNVIAPSVGSKADRSVLPGGA